MGEEGGGTELSNARLTGCCNIKPPSNPTRMGGSGTSHAPGSFECETWETKRCNESWEWWRKLGSPRYTCAPMVNNSELAFRRLVRKYGCELTYSPMISARKFLALPSDEARLALVEPDPADRPFIVQFAGDDPEHVLEAGRIIERLGVADAIDINLGCPQPQAVRDHYGSILMEEPELVERIVATAARGLGLPVTVKMRVFENRARTVELAQRIQRAGAWLLAVHGRTRSATHHEGECDWTMIRAVKESLRIPVIANGGPVRTRADADRCLRETRCDSVMCAIGLLLDPRLFAREGGPPPDPLALAHEYLDFAAGAPTTPGVSVRDHLQKLLRPLLCPASFRRGGCTDAHRDLWSVLCCNALTSHRQARALLDWYALREGLAQAPAEHPPPLREIKRGLAEPPGEAGGAAGPVGEEADELELEFDAFALFD